MTRPLIMLLLLGTRCGAWRSGGSFPASSSRRRLPQVPSASTTGSTFAPRHRATTKTTTTAAGMVVAVDACTAEDKEVGAPVARDEIRGDPVLQPLDDEFLPRSIFGTKEYWDDMYQGRGDFDAAQYSWYYDWDGPLKKLVGPHLPNKECRLFLPGIGNDPLLLDLLRAGYKRITAQDYSEYALDRQRDLLGGLEEDDDRVRLVVGDVRALPPHWRHQYDAVLEKGLLDAVYLSGDGQVERAVRCLSNTLRPGGTFVSVSGVVPGELRRQLFPKEDWLWMRDGSLDLQAGCFIFQKKQ